MGWEGGGRSQNSLSDVFQSPGAEEKQTLVVLPGDQSISQRLINAVSHC